jgi:hypothetical protein
MNSFEKAVAVEYAECTSPKWANPKLFSPLDMRPVLVDPIGFIDAAGEN